MAKSLTIEQRYCNQSDYCMPFYAGFHPYFAATNKSGVKLTLPHREMEDFLTGETRLLPEIIDFDALAETNGALHNINTNSVKLDNFGQQRAIEIHFTPPYQHIVLWALKDKPFLCVEPCMGINNGLNLAESVVELAAHACLETSVTFSIKD
jgi:galactose mutarotase-like enzyme